MLTKLDKKDIVFISIYFVEQVALVLLYMVLPALVRIWVTTFPVIFLSTMAIEKVLLKAEFQGKIDNYTAPKEIERKRYKEFKELKKSVLSILK